ncbi:MAG: phage shock protein operon transcriptional activator [Gammaproteobacteria bacterium]|nr:phage shock protein operon transcriptional activator [Gammaproteobacteria bacterium]
MSTPISDTTPMIGESPAFVAMLEHVSRVAALTKPVLIIGERGTGKELVATRLHYLSPRWEEPLVKLNCSALTESLLDSELFGHEAGAFTGAEKRHIGRFERADGGTLLLDELATIPARMQEKILRVIEYGEFERVGGSETLRVDVRMLGATNADLPDLARQGKFRADLLDRLAFDVVNVPPLRQRREDILPLAEHFAINVIRELGREFFPGFTAECSAELLADRWPGNVRGLKNSVERSVYRSTDPDAPIARIVFDPFETSHQSAASAEPVPDTASDAAEPSKPSVGQPTDLPTDLKRQVADLEKRLIDQAMQVSRYRQPQAAELLGLTYNQLRAMLRKYELIERYGRARN